MNISKNAFGNLTLGYDIPDTNELLNAIDSCESDILNLNEQISALDSSVSDLQNQVICKRVFTKDINPSIA